jgi:type IV pilus assembly protein PilE
MLQLSKKGIAMKKQLRNQVNLSQIKSAQSGFTLIEVMITVVIIGILAAIAIPSYTGYIKKARAAEATSALADIKVKMEQAYQDNRFYSCPTGLSATATQYQGARFFETKCELPAGTRPQTFLLTSTGLAAQDMTGFEFTINELNQRGSIFDGTSGACWLTSKGGTC